MLPICILVSWNSSCCNDDVMMYHLFFMRLQLTRRPCEQDTTPFHTTTMYTLPPSTTETVPASTVPTTPEADVLTTEDYDFDDMETDAAVPEERPPTTTTIEAPTTKWVGVFVPKDKEQAVPEFTTTTTTTTEDPTTTPSELGSFIAQDTDYYYDDDEIGELKKKKNTKKKEGYHIV